MFPSNLFRGRCGNKRPPRTISQLVQAVRAFKVFSPVQSLKIAGGLWAISFYTYTQKSFILAVKSLHRDLVFSSVDNNQSGVTQRLIEGSRWALMNNKHPNYPEKNIVSMSETNKQHNNSQKIKRINCVKNVEKSRQSQLQSKYFGNRPLFVPGLDVAIIESWLN